MIHSSRCEYLLSSLSLRNDWSSMAIASLSFKILILR